MHRGGPYVASDSPRSIRSQSGSTLGRRAHRHRTVPACWRARDVPICRLLGEERTTPGLSKNQDTESCDLFHPRGQTAMARQSGTKLRIVAAEACRTVSGQTGTNRVGWYACPRRTLFATEWSAARRKRPTAAALHLGAAISANLKAVRFRRAAAENFRPEIFEARATLRSQRESAVGRRIAKPQESPFVRRPYRTPPPPHPLRSVPVC